MKRATYKVVGGDILLEKLSRMQSDVVQVLDKATHAGAAVVVKAANPLAPEPRIEAASVESKKRLTAAVDVSMPDEQWYWRFLETGATEHEIKGPLAIEFPEGFALVGGAQHPGIAARPFLRPAFDATAGDENGLAVRAIREVVYAIMRGLCE